MFLKVVVHELRELSCMAVYGTNYWSTWIIFFVDLWEYVECFGSFVFSMLAVFSVSRLDLCRESMIELTCLLCSCVKSLLHFT